eukprot:CAMPEP_0171297568 /NCGR_PEP_ID=MMETSP0816-20121228/6310_1 /TAXON_ID=420281 /ORGANISM="Proboscia inermis, Strain CCAP1064/1" /LENGTH=37 /DNA_ID= /DNA_START= /DNA_END= /DNA_ORIENTATION=
MDMARKNMVMMSIIMSVTKIKLVATNTTKRRMNLKIA